ncbi:MAG: hypothetical protein V5A72_01970 [Candidatus Nanohaloarchaea archaeon]
MNSLSSTNYHNDFANISHEEGSLRTGSGRVEDLLAQGERFDVIYRESGEIIGEGEVREEGIESSEALNLFLGEIGEFDRYMATWNGLGSVDRLRLYENEREGLLGRFFPKRGQELIFEYLEE